MEILAPVGNFECLKAAVACGADAVYLGMQKYGARADAGNFSRQDLARAIEYSHLHGVKVYVTANTLIKPTEMSDAVQEVRYTWQAGADAFIVQDLGLITELNKTVPKIVLHASTQMGICNVHGANFAKSLGVSRVVLAREALPQDITAIKNETGLQTEVFCQGALCVAYSGNCYYSSLVSGCSGNRGRCLQLCRKKYECNGKSGYYLSAKDICLINEIDALKACGVDSLKIEGRLRTPEYVAETVSVFKKALSVKPDGNSLIRLKKVFNRGNYCGAYLKKPTENVIYSVAQNNIGFSIGKVSAVKGKKATLKTVEPLIPGDGVKYLHNGIEVGGGLIDGNPTGYRGNIATGDEVCLTSSVALKNYVDKLDARIATDVEVCLTTQQVSVTLRCNGVLSTAKSEIVAQNAVNRAVTREDIISAIGTLGGTDFVLRNLSVNLGENLFFPMSDIKSLRKQAIEKIKAKLLNTNAPKPRNTQYNPANINWFHYIKPSVFLYVENADDVNKVQFGYNYVILSPNDYSDYDIIKENCIRLKNNVLLNLPVITRGNDLPIISRLNDLPIEGVVANNISHFDIFRNKKILGGIGLNFLNDNFGGKYINSVESDFTGKGIRYAFGKVPLMQFAHCPKQTQGGNCNGCNGYSIRITDDKNTQFEFRRIKQHYCYSSLIPQNPIVNLPVGNNESVIIDLRGCSDEQIEELNYCINNRKAYSLPCMHANYRRELQ